MIGSTISHYTILAKLGEGGMGVVHKAHDTRRNRDVALKILPHHLTSHEPERARFLQEAQAAAALNHPHICAIYSIGEDGDQQFIEMEYVDGRTLRKAIEDGGLKIEDGIAYAIQIAEALQEAHAHGIVHRDIKADNIMVTAKNHIKVMDFGLAKLKGSTLLTRTSDTAGTLAYMAPEQIQGNGTDARSDIFSFGVVLFQMLTGHMPFRGDHEAAVMYSIINEEPEPLQRYIPDAPSELIHILNRALEKDYEERYQSMNDMLIDLRRLKKQSTRVVRSDGMPAFSGPKIGEIEATAPVHMFRIVRRTPWIFGVGLFLVAVAATAVLLLWRTGPQLNPDSTFRSLATPLRNMSYGSLSGDGNWLVCWGSDDRGNYDIYMMNVSSGQSRRITTDSCFLINGADLSPDGSTIVYSRIDWKAKGAVVTVPSVGGTSRVITNGGSGCRWIKEGKRISFLGQSILPANRHTNEIWSCRPDGSDARIEYSDTVRNTVNNRNGYAFSPDCRKIAWTRAGEDESSEIVIHDLETGHELQLTNDKAFADDPIWLPNGLVVFSSTRAGNCNLWAAPAAGGDLIQVTRGAGPDTPCGYSSGADRLIYVERQVVGHINVVDPGSGSVLQLTIEDRGRSAPSISATGRYVAFLEQGGDATSAKGNVVLIDREAATTRRLTDDNDVKKAAAISPDGSWVLYSSRGASESADSSRIFLIRVSDPGQKILLGYGSSVMWLSNTEFIVGYAPTVTLYRGSVEDRSMRRSGLDSVNSFLAPGKKYTLTWDSRESHKGVWSGSGAKKIPGGGERHLLPKIPRTAQFAWDINALFYRLPGSDIMQSMTLPDGKPLRFKNLPLRVLGQFGVRGDGKELVYTATSIRARYVAIEGLLK